jgi:hypothetical protein
MHRLHGSFCQRHAILVRIGSAALAALCVAAATSVPAEGKVFARYAKPLKSATLDLATGTVTRGSRVLERAGSTIADFTNIDLGGFIGVDTGSGVCEWIDAGAKGFAGNASDLMTDVVFAYCSTMADVASGGPGGSVMLGFYEGYTVGGPAPTTAVGLFNLTGLPAHTANSSFLALVLGSGSASCYFLNLVFGECIAFADGPIGYSWRFTDVGTTSVLAATFPFLACIQSCSGVGPDSQGMVDFLDQYCPPGNPQTISFSFGTSKGPYFTSISMEIREAKDAEATAATFAGDGHNDHELDTGAIAIGASWSPSITLRRPHQPTGNAPMNVRVRASCVNGATLSSPFGGRPVELLVTGPLALTLTSTHGPGQNVSWPLPSFAVPCDIGLVGLTWAAQGTVLGGGFADLTDARCGVVGSIDVFQDP